ncbi:MAG: bifunctional sugar-1-phosphate nucleotidylyltransferase/acetyltransferase [Dehalococcoidales bacterium]
MKAVILAAGEGKRMHPLTYTRPKAMLPIANKPILEHLLIQAARAGVEEFIFIVGYQEELVRRHFGDGQKWGVAIDYVTQRKQLGTADAINTVRDRLQGNFLVMNGDIIAGWEDIGRLAGCATDTMCLTEVSQTTGLGVVATKGDAVIRIYEKKADPPSRMANSGLYLFTPAVFKAINATKKSLRGEYEITDSIQLMIDGGHKIGHQRLNQWLELSYPWELLWANECVLDDLEAGVRGEVEDNVVIKGAVSLGENSRIRSGCYIIGPVVIGRGCDIGPNSYIRPATAIGDGCRIGAFVEVKNSIVMEGTKIPHHNYVGDSVIGQGCNMGAGSKIANVRLDRKVIRVAGIDTGRRKLGAILGDGVETGINASINTGSLIGNNVFIGPGVVAHGVVAPGSRVF